MDGFPSSWEESGGICQCRVYTGFCLLNEGLFQAIYWHAAEQAVALMWVFTTSTGNAQWAENNERNIKTEMESRS